LISVETRLVAIYTRLLVCLPSGFRDEFSEEMEQVFARRIWEAGSRGRGVMLRVFVEELLTLPRLLLLVYQRDMKQFLASLVIFAFILGVWVIFAFVVVTLASFLPGEELVALVGGGVSMLGLFVAIGIAARLVGRTLARFSNSRPDGYNRTR
jgi:hypothetical protein